MRATGEGAEDLRVNIFWYKKLLVSQKRLKDKILEILSIFHMERPADIGPGIMHVNGGA